MKADAMNTHRQTMTLQDPSGPVACSAMAWACGRIAIRGARALSAA